MSRFDTIDLSQLPAPAAIEELSFEAYLAEFKADLVARCAEEGIDYDVSSLETDPLIIVLEVAAARELKLRGMANDRVRAVMLAKSQRSDLEGLGGLYSLKRETITPATGNTPAVMEDDERLRSRIQGAPEAFSVAGPFGAYVHLAKRAHVSIKDVRAYSIPGTGEVHVIPLVNSGNGAPSSDVIERVHLALSKDDAIPGTDIPMVRAPAITAYEIRLKLRVKRGPDRASIETVSRAALIDYAASRHLVGEPVFLAGITAAAKVGGVENVIIETPAADLVPAIDAAFWCSDILVTSEVVS